MWIDGYGGRFEGNPVLVNKLSELDWLREVMEGLDEVNT